MSACRNLSRLFHAVTLLFLGFVVDRAKLDNFMGSFVPFSLFLSFDIK